MIHARQYVYETGAPITSTEGNVLHYSNSYVEWLESRLTLALSRIKAAEALIKYAKLLNHVQPEYENWQASIRAMEGTK